MTAWFQRLQRRERIMLLASAVAFVVIVGYFQVWEPYRAENQRLAQALVERQALLAWIQGAAEEVTALRGTGTSRGSTAGQSLLGIINQTARSGLGNALKKVEERQRETVHVWLEEVPFDALILWLGRLDRDHGVNIASVIVEDRPDAGVVNARIVLKGDAG